MTEVSDPDPPGRKGEKLMIVVIGCFSGVFYYALFRVAMALLHAF